MFRVESVVGAYVSHGSLGFAWAHLGASNGRRVHSGSSGFIQARQGVAVFIPVRVGSLQSA